MAECTCSGRCSVMTSIVRCSRASSGLLLPSLIITIPVRTCKKASWDDKIAVSHREGWGRHTYHDMSQSINSLSNSDQSFLLSWVSPSWDRLSSFSLKEQKAEILVSETGFALRGKLVDEKLLPRLLFIPPCSSFQAFVSFQKDCLHPSVLGATVVTTGFLVSIERVKGFLARNNAQPISNKWRSSPLTLCTFSCFSRNTCFSSQQCRELNVRRKRECLNLHLFLGTFKIQTDSIFPTKLSKALAEWKN